MFNILETRGRLSRVGGFFRQFDPKPRLRVQQESGRRHARGSLFPEEVVPVTRLEMISLQKSVEIFGEARNNPLGGGVEKKEPIACHS